MFHEPTAVKSCSRHAAVRANYHVGISEEYTGNTETEPLAAVSEKDARHFSSSVATRLRCDVMRCLITAFALLHI